MWVGIVGAVVAVARRDDGRPASSSMIILNADSELRREAPATKSAADTKSRRRRGLICVGHG